MTARTHHHHGGDFEKNQTFPLSTEQIRALVSPCSVPDNTPVVTALKEAIQSQLSLYEHCSDERRKEEIHKLIRAYMDLILMYSDPNSTIH